MSHIHTTESMNLPTTASPIRPSPLSFDIGRYRVSPLSRRTDNGEYVASISLRSGFGSTSHDRVFRLLPLFPNEQAALDFAAHQGREMAMQQVAVC